MSFIALVMRVAARKYWHMVKLCRSTMNLFILRYDCLLSRLLGNWKSNGMDYARFNMFRYVGSRDYERNLEFHFHASCHVKLCKNFVCHGNKMINDNRFEHIVASIYQKKKKLCPEIVSHRVSRPLCDSAISRVANWKTQSREKSDHKFTARSNSNYAPVSHFWLSCAPIHWAQQNARMILRDVFVSVKMNRIFYFLLNINFKLMISL